MRKTLFLFLLMLPGCTDYVSIQAVERAAELCKANEGLWYVAQPYSNEGKVRCRNGAEFTFSIPTRQQRWVWVME